MAKTTINTASKVEKVEKVEEMEKIVLNNVDHEWSDVLKYIASGKDVVFEAEPELILPEPHSEVYKALPFPIQFQWTQRKAHAQAKRTRRHTTNSHRTRTRERSYRLHTLSQPTQSNARRRTKECKPTETKRNNS